MSSKNGVEAIARGDWSAVSARFAVAGVGTFTPAPGVLRLTPKRPVARQVLLSVGVHGDETAPIELVAGLLATFPPEKLAVDVLLVVGNPQAIALNKRFVDVDLNRTFDDTQKKDVAMVESVRAAELMKAVAGFFQRGKAHLHFDLHTTIRASRIPCFAMVPGCVAVENLTEMLAWMSFASIHAWVENVKPTPTFVRFSASGFDCASATLELARVGRIGNNNLAQLAPCARMLETLLSGQVCYAITPPVRYRLAQEISRQDDSFALDFDDAIANFTAFQKGDLLAHEAGREYRVMADTEYVLFPNAKVAPGQRALLTLIQD